MIRRSVVLKLWLTIIVLVLVVLAILALYLEQFFDSYVTTMQKRDLSSQALLVGQLLRKDQQGILDATISAGSTSALHSHYYIVPRSGHGSSLASFLSTATRAEQALLAQGMPVIRSGVPGFLPAPDPRTNLYAVMPIRVSAQPPRTFLIITESRDVAGDPTRTISGLIGFAVILGTLLTTGLAFVVSKNLSRPVLEMNAAAEEMARGRFDLRVRVITQDEVGRLGQTLNHVAAELERSVSALTKEKEEITGILRAMTDAVVACDLEGQLTLYNPAAEMQLLDAQYSIDRTPDTHLLPEELIALMQDALDARNAVDRELVWKGRELVATVTPLFEPGDMTRLRGTLAVVRDVTEERRLDQMRKDFVANVSHELRTPLSLFQGYAEALLDDFGDDPNQRREFTQIIHDESIRMRRLVNELLDLAQLESGHFSLHIQEIEVGSILQRVARKFQGLFHDRGLQLQVQLGAPVLTVYGDADRLEQILTNLVDNAARHTATGGVTLSAVVSHPMIVIAVADTGEGIPKEDLPFVFERFYKADKARTRSRGGTGLGLSIARSLVRAHGGQISVDSVVGKGTVFSISLPIPDA